MEIFISRQLCRLISLPNFQIIQKLYIRIEKYRRCLYLTKLIIFLAEYTRDCTKGIEEDDRRLLD